MSVTSTLLLARLDAVGESADPNEADDDDDADDVGNEI
jgi:hypothetical protein